MQQQYIAQAAMSLRFVPAWRWWYIGLVVVGNVADNSVRHLKHNSWLTTPHPSVICVELLGHSRQPMTGRLATRPNNTEVKRCYCFTWSVCLSVNKWKFYALRLADSRTYAVLSRQRDQPHETDQAWSVWYFTVNVRVTVTRSDNQVTEVDRPVRFNCSRSTEFSWLQKTSIWQRTTLFSLHASSAASNELYRCGFGRRFSTKTSYD